MSTDTNPTQTETTIDRVEHEISLLPSSSSDPWEIRSVLEDLLALGYTLDREPSSSAADDGSLPAVLAAGRWPTNGHLIADVARLYLEPDSYVLDPTYGLGRWWTEYRPDRLEASDLDPEKSPTGTSVDFRALPHPPDLFDVVAFDPPYVSVGGRTTSTVPGMLNAYGIDSAPTSPAGVQALIDAGLAEAARVARPSGLILCKCMDYVSSGRLWPGTHHTLTAALGLELELVDRFEHVGEPGPQPTTNPDGSPRRQVHARRNLSTLFVFRASSRPSAQGSLFG